MATVGEPLRKSWYRKLRIPMAWAVAVSDAAASRSRWRTAPAG